MNARRLTEEQARKVYAILVERLEAASRDEGSFIRYLTDASQFGHHEWRFQGSLGFGGKLRFNGNREGRPHVTCYPEDVTPSRRKLIDEVNVLLAEIG